MICTKCKTDRPINCYHKDNSKPSGLHSICKLCHKANYLARRASCPEFVDRARQASRNWRLNNVERSKASVRNSTLKLKYGIDEAEYKRLLAEQGNCCAICGGTESKGNGQMHVDHDHKTGKIRGILCQACNVTLGKMDDRPDLLRLAAEYLEKHLSES